MSAQPLPALPEELTRLLQGLDAGTLWWLSGYTAALAQGRAAVPAPAAPIAVPVTSRMVPGASDAARLTLVYGSQTGNSRRVAEQVAREAEAAGLGVRLLRADAYPLRELASERLLYVVISTQGDGDPPDDAQGFVEFLAGKRAPKLPELKYAVLGLGDSSYPLFCAIGRKLDARLTELGAQRLFATGEADVDVDTVAAPWRAQALAAAREALQPEAAAVVTPLPGVSLTGIAGGVPANSSPGGFAGGAFANVTPLRSGFAAWTREKPFAGRDSSTNQRITARVTAASRCAIIELSLAGSGLDLRAGRCTRRVAPQSGRRW